MSDRPAPQPPRGPGRRFGAFPRSRAREAHPDGHHTHHDTYSTRGPVPVAALSIWDPVFLGIDEVGVAVYLDLPYRNILIGGEPGAGKSVALNNIVAHCALAPDVRLWLLDGKQVELGLWAPVADVFVGNDVQHALRALTALQAEMDTRYHALTTAKRRKITRSDDCPMIVCVVDEIAYFSATVGTRHTQEQFTALLRDLVARGRAAGIIVVAATQRPSADIIPTSLRDLFGYRLAFRCTTDSSSDIILGVGWAKEGHSAKKIDAADRGVGLLLGEGDTPRRHKSAYLTDADIADLVTRAAWVRGPNPHGLNGQPGGEVA